MGMGVTPDHDRGALGEAPITPTQADALAFGKIDQLLDRTMVEPGVGGMRNRLLLHGGVDDHPFQIPGLQRAAAVRHRKALLQQRRKLLLAQPLAPARQRGAVEWQVVPQSPIADAARIANAKIARRKSLKKQRHAQKVSGAGLYPDEER
jgi:hypothetical protein